MSSKWLNVCGRGRRSSGQPWSTWAATTRQAMSWFGSARLPLLAAIVVVIEVASCRAMLVGASR